MTGRRVRVLDRETHEHRHVRLRRENLAEALHMRRPRSTAATGMTAHSAGQARSADSVGPACQTGVLTLRSTRWPFLCRPSGP